MNNKHNRQRIAILLVGALLLSGTELHTVRSSSATKQIESYTNRLVITEKKQRKRISNKLDKLIKRAAKKETASAEPVLKIVEPVSDNTLNLSTAYEWLNDTYFSRQWYINSIYVQDVWIQLENSNRRPGSDIVVAVVDTGVDVTHPDLADNIWVNTAEQNGITGVDDDNNGYVDDIYGGNIVAPGATLTDAHGHGTQMAGIIGMTSGNSIGGAGVAYGAMLMPVRVTAQSEFTVAAALRGLQYAVNNGADIISMSFSSTTPSSELEEAMKLVGERCITVAAAGNNGKDMSAPCYPAAYDSVTGVMSFGNGGYISDFSNWDSNPQSGPEYEIAAPGEEIFSTNRSRTFAEASGTSHATAVVSGAMAIVLSELRLSGIKPSPKEFKSYFLSNMRHGTIPDYNHGGYSFRRLDVRDAVTYVTSEFRTFTPAPTVPPTQTPVPTATPVITPAPTTGIPTVPPLPTPAPTDENTVTPTATPTQETPVATVIPVTTSSPEPYVVKTGTVLRAGKNGKRAFYRVTNAEKRRVTYYTCDVKKSRKKAQVPNYIELPDGKMYQITDIRKYCFSTRKKIRKVTVYAKKITKKKMKKASRGSNGKKRVYKN